MRRKREERSLSGRADPELHDVRVAFDRIAPDIDRVLVRNPINAWMHKVNSSFVQGTFPPGATLLELGCGTGTDAIDLARAGRRVFGIDLSEAMVSHARRKAALARLTDRVAFVQGRSRDLVDLVRASPWRSFDGAYANFSLTYEPSLEAVVAGLGRILAPGANVVCTLTNRVVLSEVLIYSPQLRFRKVLWRLTQPLMRDLHGTSVEIHAYSPRQVRRAFDPDFELRGLVGVPTFLPPTYLHAQYRHLGGAQRLLQSLDESLAGRFPWNRLGEHTLYWFQRRQG